MVCSFQPGPALGIAVLGAQPSPCQMKALFVAVDMFESKIRVLGVPQGHSQLMVTASLVDQVLT